MRLIIDGVFIFGPPSFMHSNRPAAAWGGQLLVHHRRIRRRRRRRRRLWQRICGSGAASTRSVASPYIVKLISFCCYSCCFALRPRNRNAPRSIRPFFFQEGQNLSVLFFFYFNLELFFK